MEPLGFLLSGALIGILAFQFHKHKKIRYSYYGEKKKKIDKARYQLVNEEVPTHDCRFIASWVCNDQLWASTFKIENGEILEFCPGGDMFIPTTMAFREKEPNYTKLSIMVCD